MDDVYSGFSFEELTKALQSEDNELRAAAARRLGELGDLRAVELLIHSLIEDIDRWVRGRGAEALGRLKSPLAIEALKWTSEHDKGILGGAETTVRQVALEALKLIAIGNEKDVENLINALKNPDSDIRWYAARALGSLPDTRAVQALVEVLRDQKSIVRFFAVRALGEIADAQAVSALQRIQQTDRGKWKGLKIKEEAEFAIKKIVGTSEGQAS